MKKNLTRLTQNPYIIEELIYDPMVSLKIQKKTRIVIEVKGSQ